MFHCVSIHVGHSDQRKKKQNKKQPNKNTDCSNSQITCKHFREPQTMQRGECVIITGMYISSERAQWAEKLPKKPNQNKQKTHNTCWQNIKHSKSMKYISTCPHLLFSVGFILHEHAEVHRNKSLGPVVCRIISKCHITETERMQRL